MSTSLQEQDGVVKIAYGGSSAQELADMNPSQSSSYLADGVLTKETSYMPNGLADEEVRIRWYQTTIFNILLGIVLVAAFLIATGAVVVVIATGGHLFGECSGVQFVVIAVLYIICLIFISLLGFQIISNLISRGYLKINAVQTVSSPNPRDEVEVQQLNNAFDQAAGQEDFASDDHDRYDDILGNDAQRQKRMEYNKRQVQKRKEKMMNAGLFLAKRIIKYILKAILVLVGLLFLFIHVVVCLSYIGVTQISVAQYSGILHVSGKNAAATGTTTPIMLQYNITNAKLLRENNGMVHIVGDTDYDVFFAQGVYAAQERLFQLELLKRVARGTVAELIGSEAVSLDKMSRTLGLYQNAVENVKHLPKKSLEILQAFCDGVNAFLNVRLPTSVEFNLLQASPSRMEPADVIAFLKLMSFDLSGNLNHELTRLRLLSMGISKERIEELIPAYPINSPTVTTSQQLQLNITNLEADVVETKFRDNSGAFVPIVEPDPNDEKRNIFESAQDFFNLNELGRKFFGKQYGTQASNNFVIGGLKALFGQSILANDPHLDLSAPGVWYLCHLESKETNLNSIGSCFPNAPGVIIGRNKDISWGVTNSNVDNQDLYVLVEDQPGVSYMYQGKSTGYTVREEEIKVKNGDSVRILVKNSVYGPVVNDIFNVPITSPISLKWTSLSEQDPTVDSFLQLNRAKNWEEFKESLRAYVAPAQNFIFADNFGNIGYVLPGAVPIRKQGHSGGYAVRGTGEFDYSGYVPFDSLPKVFNPAEGYIISANNRITPRGFPYHIAYDYDYPFRATRIRNAIEEKLAFNNGTLLTMKDIKDVQLDVKSQLFEDIKSIFSRMVFEPETSYEMYRTKLSAWDGAEKSGSLEATIFEAFLKQMYNLAASETSSKKWTNLNYIRNALLNGDKNCEGGVCSDYATEAFKNGIDSLEGTFGGVIPTWGVGIHKIKFDNVILQFSPVRCFSSKSTFISGGTETVNVSPTNDNFESSFGVSYRQVIEMSSNTTDQFVLPLGNSGNIFSKYYDNLMKMWVDGAYSDMKYENYKTTYILELK